MILERRVHISLGKVSRITCFGKQAKICELEFLNDFCPISQHFPPIPRQVRSMGKHQSEKCNADGEKFESVGFMGGKGGTRTKLGILRKGERLEYRTFDLKYLEPGDILVSDSGGGGGVGDPLDREVEKVRWDALNEYISIQAANDVYGVVIAPKTFEVDNEATKALRAKLKKEKGMEASS